MTGQPDVRTVGVLGCGIMGSGIAQSVASAGYTVIVYEPDPVARDTGARAIERSLARLEEKQKVPAGTRQAALARLTLAASLDALAGVDLAIEAVTEDLAIKNGLWRSLDALCPAHAIFASNTSSLTIAAMAAATSRPDQFVGLHFFNPVPLMPLVEVVRTVTTSAPTFQRALAFARSLGKEAVAARDTSGFIVNRLLVPYMLDAVRALEANVASMTDIDTAMRLGCGHPMGPFTLLDFVGLDTAHRIAEIMFTEYRETRYAPPPLLTRMVLAGLAGRKSGRGFYDYSTEPPTPVDLGL